jgi:hypothetical protein
VDLIDLVQDGGRWWYRIGAGGGAGWGQVAGSYEYGNKPSVCIICGKFLDLLRNY